MADIKFPMDTTRVAPAGTKVLVADAFGVIRHILPEDITGEKGDQGWSAVLGLADRGVDKVFVITDFIGGAGDKPLDEVGKYIGATGYVSNINDAAALPVGKGDAFTFEDFTPEQLEDLKVISNNFINANDYGFLPTNTASQNRIALQNVLNGGNKEIIVTIQGVYPLDGTVFLDDWTKISFARGVSLSKEALYTYIFINRKAINREWNYGIEIKNLVFSINGNEKRPETNEPLYGLHGHISFFYVKGLKLNGVECTDLGSGQYGVQICTWRDLEASNIHLEGNKDGVHLGTGKNGTLKIAKFKTYDDSIALNCFDWTAGNPEIGNIEDLHVEDINDDYNESWAPFGSNMFRFLVGTAGIWVTGMQVWNGTAVIHNGNLYRAFTVYGSSTPILSTTEPNLSSFASLQETVEGILWKRTQTGITGSYLKAEVLNFTANKIKHIAPGRLASIEKDTLGEYNHTIHPSIPDAQLPIVDVSFEDFKSDKGYIDYDGKIVFYLKIINKRLSDDYTFIKNVGGTVAFKAFITLIGCELSNNTSPQYLIGNIKFKMIGNNVITKNGLTLRCKNGTSVNSDSNILLFNPDYPSGDQYDHLDDMSSIKGDEIKSNGVKKIFNGSIWVDVI